MIDIADIESSALHNNYIGTEHLLLAAVRDEGSVAAKFFTGEGYTIMDLRFTVMELQADGGSSIRQQNAESLVDSVFRSLLNDDAGGGLFGVFEEKKSDNFKESFSITNDLSSAHFLSRYSEINTCSFNDGIGIIRLRISSADTRNRISNIPFAYFLNSF